MISIGRSGTLLGLVVITSLVGAAPVLADSTTTPVSGSLGPTQDGCLQLLTVTVSDGENCMYDGGPSSVPAATPKTGPKSSVTGSYLQNAYYDSVQNPAAFQTTIVGAARVLYIPTAGDQKMSQNITGSVTIDDNGDGFGAGDLISFTLTLTSSGPGSIVRNYLSSTNSVVDKYDSMTQVLAPTAATSATPNVSGGFDYVIGSEGFPARRTFSEAGPCLGQALGYVICDHTFAPYPSKEPNYWDGTSLAGIGSLESNLGARTTGTVTNLQCIDARLPTGVETNDCRDSGVSFAPWLIGPCQAKAGCTGNASTPGSERGAAEDVGWDQLLLRVSTDAGGNVTSVSGFNVDEYNVFGTDACGNNTVNTDDWSYDVNCNSWVSGSFTLNAATGGQANDDGPYFATPGFNLGIPVLANDTNFNNPVTVTVSTAPTQGAAVVLGSPGSAAGISIQYTANAGATGSDSFQYTVTDGVSTGSATVSLVIGAGANEDLATTTRNQPVNIQVGVNDPGFDNSVTVTVNNGSFTAGGSAMVTAGNGGPASGVIVAYTPVSAAYSPSYVETFTYTLDDGVQPASTATVAVTVNNSSPENLSGGIAISTVDRAPTGGNGVPPVSGTFTAPPGGGSLGNQPSTIEVTAQGARGTAVASGSVITYTVTDSTFLYGTDSYTYTVTDLDGETATGVVSVTIPDVVPVLTDTFIVVGQGRISRPLAPDFTAGNGSPEQQTLAITAQGADGVCEVQPANGLGTIIYTPTASTFVGEDTCQLTLTDADGDTISAPIIITVTPKAKTGGAGSFDLMSLLLLGFAPLLRRRSKSPGPAKSARIAAMAVALLAVLVAGGNASGQTTDADSESMPITEAVDTKEPEPPVPAGETAKGSGFLDEIVVTSRKIEEKLLEVPLAITAFDSNAIETLGIRNLADVATLTPGLSFFNPAGEALPVPIIRGIVPTDIFGENNTAIFVDGVYISGREGLNFSQLDVERIEVVKGPQSALYGRNAFSGAINYVTKAPSEEFEAKTNFSLGNRDQVVASGVVSGPILGEKLRGRVAALYDDWDGSYNNAIPGGNDVGGHRYRSIQSSLIWLPADAWTVNLNYYYSNDKIDDSAIVGLLANCQDVVGDNNATTRYQNYCGSIPALKYIPGQNYSESIAKIPQATGENRDLDRGNLKIDWDLYELGSITSLTGYSDTKQNSAIDFTRNLGENQVFLYCENAATGTPGAPNSCGSNPANSRFYTGILDDEPGAQTEETSQELRYTSSQDQRWRYTAGGYWFKTTKKSSAAGLRGYTVATQPVPGGQPLGVGPIGLPPFDAGTPDLAIGTAIFYTTFTPDGGRDPLNRTKVDNDDEGWALFSGTDFDINDQLTARAELRLSQDKQTIRDIVYATCATKTDPACGDDQYDLRVTGQQPYLNSDGECVIDGVPTSVASCSKQLSDRFKSWTGRIGLDWQITEDWMVYSSIATGDKPGGLQLLPGLVPSSDGTTSTPVVVNNSFDTEKLTAYELGLKGTTWDGRLVVSTAVFYNDWTNIVQRELLFNDPASGQPFEQPVGINRNSADAKVYGFEIETNLGITENLTGRFTASWTHAEITNGLTSTYDDFPDFAAQGYTGASGDISGNTLLRQPEWLLSGSLGYQHELAGEWDWYASGDANYQSGLYVGNDNQSWIPSHTYVNTKLGAENSVYSIEAWSRNIFNQHQAVAAYRDIYFANTDNQVPPAVDQGPRPNFDDFVPWRYTVSYPNERTIGVTLRMRFGAAAK